MNDTDEILNRKHPQSLPVVATTTHSPASGKLTPLGNPAAELGAPGIPAAGILVRIESAGGPMRVARSSNVARMSRGTATHFRSAVPPNCLLNAYETVPGIGARG